MKKPFLYILPFLLLSSLAWAESELPECEGTDYRQWTNCQGTMTLPDGNKYVGEWKDGQWHGQGTMTLPDGKLAWAENQLPECEGTDYRQWTNCQGTWNENNILTYMTWANGQKYVGEWKDGKYHGQGTYTWPDGKKYVGEWKDGKYHGPGTIDGRVIDAGIWKDNKLVSELSECEGSPATDGKLAWAESQLPECEGTDYRQWTNCQGTWNENNILTYMTRSDGEKYVGEWKDGKYHGQGTCTWPDGKKYVGEWKDGKYHGQGTWTPDMALSEKWTNCYGNHTFTDEDGSSFKYVGEWKDGKKHGQGTWTSPDGGYVGEFKDGKRHGRGAYTNSGGYQYFGEWKDGKEHGQGSSILETDGCDGEFRDGDYIPGSGVCWY